MCRGACSPPLSSSGACAQVVAKGHCSDNTPKRRIGQSLAPHRWSLLNYPITVRSFHKGSVKLSDHFLQKTCLAIYCSVCEANLSPSEVPVVEYSGRNDSLVVVVAGGAVVETRVVA